MIKEITAKTILNYVKQPDTWFGMSLRSGQREYFYAKLDKLFPGMRRKYEIRYGEQYQCAVPNAQELYQLFDGLCKKYGITKKMKVYEEFGAEQGELFI